MGSLLSPTHIIIILLVILVLFGRGKISDFMGDFAKGIKSFKQGMKDEDEAEDVEKSAMKPAKTIDLQAQEHAEPVKRRANVSKATKTTKTTKAKTKS